MSLAMKSFVKMQLEGEKSTCFFYKMNRKHLANAPFEEVHLEEVDESGRETIKVIRKQESIKWGVRKFYYNLYSKREAKIAREDILKNTDVLT